MVDEDVPPEHEKMASWRQRWSGEFAELEDKLRSGYTYLVSFTTSQTNNIVGDSGPGRMLEGRGAFEPQVRPHERDAARSAAW